MAHKKTSFTVEKRVRRIIREELSGINASIESDPIHNASSLIERLNTLLSYPDDEVDLKEVRRKVNNLRNTLPDIVEEINIIRDTFVNE